MSLLRPGLGGNVWEGCVLLPRHPIRISTKATGGKIAGGQSRKIGPGDVVIVPPDTPHGWSDVSDELIYLVVRMDPKKVLKVK